MTTPRFSIRRIYDDPTPDDGFRVLVDRIWPRGVSKERAALDLWDKDLAPSTELRKWFDHRPERFAGFREKYVAELTSDDGRRIVTDFLDKVRAEKVITLLYSAHDEKHNQAVVLRDHLADVADD